MIHVCMRMCKMNTQREINRPNMSQRRNSRTDPLPHALLNMHNNMLKTGRTCRPYRHVVPKMEWAVVVNWSLRRRDFLLAWRPGNRRHDRNDHTPTVQCSGLCLSVSRACRFAWMAPARVASKSSVESWQRDRQDPRAVAALLSSVGGIPQVFRFCFSPSLYRLCRRHGSRFPSASCPQKTRLLGDACVGHSHDVSSPSELWLEA